MGLQMSVHPTSDFKDRGIYDGHDHPFLSTTCAKGWHALGGTAELEQKRLR